MTNSILNRAWLASSFQARALQSLVSLLLAGLVVGLLAHGPASAKPLFSAIAVDARTGEVLFAREADGLRHPASLTKVMTLYLLFQDLKSKRLGLGTKLRASKKASLQPPTKVGLKPGETITVENAIKALVTRSANDVAVTIAENLGGTEASFANRMTKTARALGMKRSLFRNASGLPNPAQVTTARDMAILSLRIQRDFPQYYHYFRIASFTYKGRELRNHNKLLGRYEGTDGIKTGYIRAAGYNLTTSVRRGDKRIVGVVLGARSGNARTAYMTAMLDSSLPKCQNGSGIVASISVPGARVKASAIAVDAAPVSNRKKKLWQKSESGDPGFALADDPTVAVGAIGADIDESAAKSGVAFASVSADGGEDAEEPEEAAPAEAVSAEAAVSGWNIQIGAFPSEDDAKAQLAVTRESAARVLKGKEALTLEFQKGQNTFYRARFGGFSKTQAMAACRQLNAKGRDCQLVPPQS